jgi:hypothetical protein
MRACYEADLQEISRDIGVVVGRFFYSVIIDPYVSNDASAKGVETSGKTIDGKEVEVQYV